MSVVSPDELVVRLREVDVDLERRGETKIGRGKVIQNQGTRCELKGSNDKNPALRLEEPVGAAWGIFRLCTASRRHW